MKTLRTNFYDCWAIDLRSVALVRIGLALVVLVDLTLRLILVDDLYGPNGMLPISFVEQHMPARLTHWKLYFASDSVWLPTVLICLNLLCASFLLIGYRTKLSLLLCWFLFASLFYRNGYIHSGAEYTLLVGMFWCLWLPCGAWFSIDRLRSPMPESAVQVLSGGSVGLTCQIVLYYFFSGFSKHASEWWPDGTALYYALHLETLSSDWAPYLHPYEALMQGLTRFVWLLEIFSPLLLLVLPCLFGIRWRSYVVTALILFHAGIAIFLDLGSFPYINMVILIALLPTKAWQWLLPSGAQSSGAAAMRYISLNRASYLAALAIIVLVIAQVSYTQNRTPLPKSISYLSRAFAVKQSLEFFAPKPPKRERFWFFPGKLSNGVEVDVFNLSTQTVEFNKWQAANRTDKFRRKYMAKVKGGVYNSKPLRAVFARYLCHRWRIAYAGTAQAELSEVSFIYLLEWTPEPGSSIPGYLYRSRGFRFLCDDLVDAQAPSNK